MIRHSNISIMDRIVKLFLGLILTFTTISARISGQYPESLIFGIITSFIFTPFLALIGN